MTTKKPTRKTRAPRKKTSVTSGLVQLNSVGVRLDLSPLGAQQAYASLKDALKTSAGTGLVQLRLDPRDLNAIYLILHGRQLKSLVGRLEALTGLSPRGVKVAR